MERSTRFISLSGLSGVMAGIYALMGAYAAYTMLYANGGEAYVARSGNADVLHGTNFKLFVLAAVILIVSVSTGILLTVRKARRKGSAVWSQSSKSLLLSGALPLLSGGCFIIILFMQGHYGIIAPGCLIFYGLALVAASQYTFGDVKWLGLMEIGLGILATAMPGYGLLFWAIGFGVLHIIYGTVMHFKYDREGNVN